MNYIRVTKEFTFEMAHALQGYEGKCANIHGHSYQLSVTVIGIPENNEHSSEQGMVIDFSELKKIVQEEVVEKFDHVLVLKENHPFGQTPGSSGKRMILTPYQPTCENLLIDFCNRIGSRIASPLRLYSAKLRETSTSYAEWVATDNT